MKKYGPWSAVLGLIGVLFTIAPFTSVWGWVQNPFFLIAGILCFFLSLLGAVTSISKKEKGFLKFVPFIMLVPLIFFAFNFTAIVGGV